MKKDLKSGKNNVFGLLIGAVVLIAVVAGGFWLFGSSRSGDLAAILQNDNSSRTGAGTVAGSPTSTPGLYRDTTTGFSFKYPLDATVQTTAQDDAGNGPTLLVKGKSGAEVQVALLPFDENLSLTAARIKQDIPAIVMNNAKTLQEGRASGAPVQAVYFETATTREVWFVTGGHLYQISCLLSDSRDLFDSISTGFTF